MINRLQHTIFWLSLIVCVLWGEVKFFFGGGGVSPMNYVFPGEESCGSRTPFILVSSIPTIFRSCFTAVKRTGSLHQRKKSPYKTRVPVRTTHMKRIINIRPRAVEEIYSPMLPLKTVMSANTMAHSIQRGRTTYDEIGPVADQIYEI